MKSILQEKKTGADWADARLLEDAEITLPRVEMTSKNMGICPYAVGDCRTEREAVFSERFDSLDAYDKAQRRVVQDSWITAVIRLAERIGRFLLRPYDAEKDEAPVDLPPGSPIGSALY